MSRQAFYDHIAAKLFKGSLPDWQQEPVDRIVDEGLRRKRRVEDIAYVLATAFHETARFKYMEEIGRGAGHDYGEPIWLARGARVAFFGRGFVQLTWLTNYSKMSVALTLDHGREIDLVSRPELATQPNYAALIIYAGMIRGMFTGKNLADYINDDGVDYVNARRIVNGTDKAELIAGYAREFEAGLRLIDEEPASLCPLNRAECPRAGGLQ